MNRREFVGGAATVAVGGAALYGSDRRVVLAASELVIDDVSATSKNGRVDHVTVTFDEFNISVENITTTSDDLQVDITAELDTGDEELLDSDSLNIMNSSDNFNSDDFESDLTFDLTDFFDSEVFEAESFDEPTITTVEIQVVVDHTDIEPEEFFDSFDVTVEQTEWLPESTIHHWRMNEGEGDVVEDHVGGADGQRQQNIEWVEGEWKDNYAMRDIGDDDHVITASWSQIFENLTDDFAVIGTIEADGDDSSHYIDPEAGIYDESGIKFETLSITGFGDTPEGNLWSRVEDPDGNDNRIITDFEVNDGQRRRAVFNKIGNDPHEWEIWTNGSDGSVTVDRSDGVFSTGDLSEGMSLFSAHEPVEGILDNVIVVRDSLSPVEIHRDYRQQPWVRTIDDFLEDTADNYDNIGHGSAIFDVDTEVNTPTGRGTAQIHLDTDDDDCVVSDSSGILDHHPQNGESIGLLIRTNGSIPGIAVHVDTGGDGWTGYAYYVDSVANAVRIRAYENHTTGGGDELATEEADISDADWYWMEVDYPADESWNHAVTLYDFDEGTLSIGDEIVFVDANDRDYITEETEGVLGFANILSDGNPGEVDWIRLLD